MRNFSRFSPVNICSHSHWYHLYRDVNDPEGVCNEWHLLIWFQHESSVCVLMCMCLRGCLRRPQEDAGACSRSHSPSSSLYIRCLTGPGARLTDSEHGCGVLVAAGLTGSEHPSSADLRCSWHTQLLTWVPGIWTQVLVLELECALACWAIFPALVSAWFIVLQHLSIYLSLYWGCLLSYFLFFVFYFLKQGFSP